MMPLTSTQVRELSSAIIAAIKGVFETASPQFTPTTGIDCGKTVNLDDLPKGTLVRSGTSEYFRVFGCWVRYDGAYFSSMQLAEKLWAADSRRIVHLG